MSNLYQLPAIVAIVATVFASSALAQEYPTKPIRMVIPSPAGGGTDVLARIIQGGLTKMWGQPIVVDNRAGASGRIAAALVAKSPADGYTLICTYGGLFTTGLPLFGKLPYDPIKDFSPVAMIAHVPGILVAHPSFPANTVAELIQLAKTKQLQHGSSSNGSSSHLNMELLKQMAGINMDKISYNGDSPTLTALLGGHVQFAFNNVVAAAPYIKAGRLKPLAVATSQRVPTLSNVPTVAESGVPGFEGILFYAIAAPAGVPAAVQNKLNSAIAKVKKEPDINAQLAGLGAISVDMAPAELGAFIKSELAKWTKVIKAGNLEIKP